MQFNGKQTKQNALNSIKSVNPSPYTVSMVFYIILGFVASIETINPDNVLLKIIATLISFVVSFFVVGLQWYMLEVSRSSSADPTTILEVLSKAGSVIVLLILITIKTLLWSLLLVVPGLIKAIAYSQSIYILRDHPDWTPSQCIAESERLMQGHKAELFLFELSFIGWAILTTFAMQLVGIAFIQFLPAIIVMPLMYVVVSPLCAYMYVSYSHYYNQLLVEQYDKNMSMPEYKY